MPTRPTAPPRAVAVREIIRRRAAEHSQPGARNDSYRVGLCIEGGAMRGVVSAGMVVALEQLNLLHTFDAVFGSSAGAINGAYFVAGQAGIGTTIYYENINNQRFVDLRRGIGPRPILDLDYLVWDVMCGPKRLDVARVLASPVEFHALATETASGDRAAFNAWTDREDFLNCLRAGASMPIFAGPPYGYRGRQYWDALLSEPIPAVVAEEAGCTHLLVLLTRPAATAGPRLSITDRLYVLPRLRKVSAQLAQRYVERPQRYTGLLNTLRDGRAPKGEASVLTVAPARGEVSRLERQHDRLVAGAREGMRALFDALGYDVPLDLRVHVTSTP